MLPSIVERDTSYITTEELCQPSDIFSMIEPEEIVLGDGTNEDWDLLCSSKADVHRYVCI